MVTQREIGLAHDICVYAHAGQVDKAGKPYYLHPEFVAGQVSKPEEKVVALLHDVMEDTDFPVSVLRAIFSDEVMEPLLLLKHKKGVPYMEYIKALSANRTARTVKMADLKHNMDLSRIQSPTENDYQRIEKYKKALGYLQSVS